MTIVTPTQKNNFHQQFPGAGQGKAWPQMLPWIAALPPRTRILDWGAGGGGTAAWLRDYTALHIDCWDPSHPAHQTTPLHNAYLGIYTSDVWEHIPIEVIRTHWAEIDTYSRVDRPTRHCHIIDCTPAKKILSTGENAHVTLLTPVQWQELFQQWLDVQVTQTLRQPDALYGQRVRVMLQGVRRWA
jgi:hypothetical protein